MSFTGFLMVGSECPSCKKYHAFPYTRVVKIKGQVFGLLSMKCTNCGWTPTEEEDIENNERMIKDSYDLMKMIDKEEKKNG